MRERLSYANVISTLALFIVLGGGAYAAFHLPNNSVRSKHIKNGQVKPADVKNDSLTGNDVRDDKLTGKDIDEASLGRVPEAAALDGVTVRRILVQHNRAVSDPITDFATVGPVTLSASCAETGGETLFNIWAKSSRSGMDLASVATEAFASGGSSATAPKTPATHGASSTPSGINHIVAALSTNGVGEAQVTVTINVPAGSLRSAATITVNLTAKALDANAGTECRAYGTALMAGNEPAISLP